MARRGFFLVRISLASPLGTSLDGLLDGIAARVALHADGGGRRAHGSDACRTRHRPGACATGQGVARRARCLMSFSWGPVGGYARVTRRGPSAAHGTLTVCVLVTSPHWAL